MEFGALVLPRMRFSSKAYSPYFYPQLKKPSMNTTFLIIAIVAFVLFLVLRNFNTANIPSVVPAEIPQLRRDYPNLQVIDVRTPQEIAGGKIEGAIEANVFSADFKRTIATLPKDRPYLIYCRSGQRSGGACKMMIRQGFTEVYNLKGGYQSM